MDNDVIQAEPEFRVRVMALLVNTDWLARYGTVLRPEYFPTKAEQGLVKWLNAFWDKYHSLPSKEALVHGSKDRELAEGVWDCTGDDLRYTADVVMEFAKQQAMKIAILQSIEDVQRGNLEKPQERVREAVRVGQSRLDLGLELIEDVDQWVGEELHGQRWPTGWVPIDRALDGGLSGGEYGLVMAPPGMGKTTMLINVGFGAAGLLGKANVLHVSVEIPKEQVLARYAARLTGVRLRRDDESITEDEFKHMIQKRGHRLLKGKLRVLDQKSGIRTVEGIRGVIERLEDEGFHTHELIVDYPDEMKPTHHREERRFELSDLARELRAMGADLDIPVWGATQAGRDAYYKEVITPANIAEDIGKAAVADVILALCQTREEEELNKARVFGAKIRKAASHSTWPAEVNFEQQYIKVHEKEED